MPESVVFYGTNVLKPDWCHIKMNSTNAPFGNIDQDAAFRAILEGTATETGQEFFKSLVQNLAKILKTHGAWVTEYLEECRHLRALAFW
ncbi:MAG: hypothetical protein KC931_25770, partial [Candidatus Omnitrophica bacterium]|nr:hypothetical protein [Candidatus Omnitrophota bacterium]